MLILISEEVLTFQQPLYEGAIVDNALQLSEIFLRQGYEGNTVTMEIISGNICTSYTNSGTRKPDVVVV